MRMEKGRGEKDVETENEKWRKQAATKSAEETKHDAERQHIRTH